MITISRVRLCESVGVLYGTDDATHERVTITARRAATRHIGVALAEGQRVQVNESDFLVLSRTMPGKFDAGGMQAKADYSRRVMPGELTYKERKEA